MGIPDNQKQEKVVSIPHRNPRNLRRGNQKALRQLKIDIEKPKDELFFIKHIAAGSTQAKWYLEQEDMDQSGTVAMQEYGGVLFTVVPLPVVNLT